MRERSLDTAPCPYRARRGTDVASDSNVPAHGERTHGILAIENNNKVRDIRADLQAPPYAACGYARRCGPRSVGESGDDEA